MTFCGDKLHCQAPYADSTCCWISLTKLCLSNLFLPQFCVPSCGLTTGQQEWFILVQPVFLVSYHSYCPTQAVSGSICVNMSLKFSASCFLKLYSVLVPWQHLE